MPEQCSIFIHARYIMTQDDERRMIKDGAIVINGSRILALGPAAELRPLYDPEDEIFLHDHLVLPGLVNAHTHIPMTLLRGFADDLPLMDWLNKHIFPAEKMLTRHMLEVGALLACAEMLRFGCTAFMDMYLAEDSIFHAVDKTGMKALFGEGIFAFPSIGYKNTEEAFERIRQQASELKNHPRMALAVAPHSVYTTTPDILGRCRDIASELQLPVVIHLAESKQETEVCLKMHQMRPVALCQKQGLLNSGTSIAHGVDLTEAEIDILAASNTKVTHNPKSNMKLSSGVSPVSDMLKKGICVSLGTDGPASNNAMNMFSEMSACALLHKVEEKNPTALPAGTVLDMATINGAKALHMPEKCSGSLKPGAAADLVALDLSSPNLNPVHNLASHLVYAASGLEVCFTMVDGKVLYQNGFYSTIDYPTIRAEAQDIANHFRENQ